MDDRDIMNLFKMVLFEQNVEAYKQQGISGLLLTIHKGYMKACSDEQSGLFGTYASVIEIIADLLHYRDFAEDKTKYGDVMDLLDAMIGYCEGFKDYLFNEVSKDE